MTVNGATAPDGTRVSAEVDGVEAKTGTTREGKYGYDTGTCFGWMAQPGMRWCSR